MAVAELGYKIQSDQVKVAEQRLDGMDKSAARAEKSSNKLGNTATTLAKRLAPVVAGLVSFGAAARLVGQGAQEIDRVAKSARRLESSIAGFRAMELAASEAGVSVSSLTNDVQTMAREIAGGSKNAMEALQRLGVTAQQLEGLDADEKLALIADQVKGLGLSVGETTDILRDLGVRNREVVLALIDGGDAFRSARDDVEDYGLALNEVDAARIEAANDAIGRLGLITDYAAQQFSLALTPALGRFAEAITESLREGGLLRRLIDGLAAVLERLPTFIQMAGVALVGYTGYVAAARIATLGLVGAVNTLKAALVRFLPAAIFIAIGGLLFRFKNLVDATGGWGNALTLLGEVALGVWDGIKSSANAIPPALQAIWEKVKSSFFVMIRALSEEWSRFLGSLSSGARARGLDSLADALGSASGSAFAQASKMDALIVRADNNAKSLSDTAKNIVKSGFEEAAEAAGRLSVEVEKANEELNKPFAPGGGPSVDGDGLGGGGGAGGGVGGGADNPRIQALIDSLRTEEEILAEWHAQAQLDLIMASDAELEIIGGRNEAKLRLEQEYQDRLAAIRGMGNQWALEDALHAGADILGAMGSMNKKALKLQSVFAAASALVSTYKGAAKELEKGTFGFATAAAVIARGIGFVAAIKSAASGTSSASASRGGAGASTVAQPAPQREPQTRAIIQATGGRTRFTVDEINDIIAGIQKESKDGVIIEGFTS